MTPWSWSAGIPGEEAFGLACEEPSREAAIAAARREVSPGTEFEIVEARSSTAARYESAYFVPFLRTRHHERIIA
jgi:hypothetical protein